MSERRTIRTQEEIVFNKTYQVMPDMAPEQFAALKEDIAERGVVTPIDIDEAGNILDGHHRYQACAELGIEEYPVTIRPGLSEATKRMFARKTNMMRRHLTRKQMREIIADQLRETPEWSNSRIGGELGADKKTVGTVRKKMEATGEIPRLDKTIGADGKERREPIRGVSAANKKQRESILKEIAQHVDLSQLPEGFCESAQVIKTPDYDIFANLTIEEENEWKVFHHFLVNQLGWDSDRAFVHIEWIRRNASDLKTPSEWLNYGMKWLRTIGGRQYTQAERQNDKRRKQQWHEYKNTVDGATLYTDKEAIA